MTSGVVSPLDPRITAARPDLADASLEGRVQADRFVEGRRFTVSDETLDLRRGPRPDAPLETQLLFGESVKLFDEDEGWGWVQAEHDDYVGYVALGGLRRSSERPATHRVIVNRTFVYPAADMKQPPLRALPLGGVVLVESAQGRFVRVAGSGFVIAAHLTPLEDVAQDFVSVAEQMVGVPYLWGGRSPMGIDCSGLVQLAVGVAGGGMPRDTDLQERLGQALPLDDGLTGLARGDLVFWHGHVGIMADGSTLLHANAHHMLVAKEPLAEASVRIAATGSDITSIRRPSAPGRS